MSIPKPEFPLPQRVREDWLNLNGQWDFSLNAEREYTGKILVPFSWVCPLSGVEQDVAGYAWYRRQATFKAPGKRIFLCFGAVDYDADIYINGQHVRSHRGGYTYFDCDVTDVWRDQNIIEVRSEDNRCETQTYGKQGYGDIQGIWQTVWLEARPQNYIERFRVVTHVDGRVSITATAHMSKAGTATLRAEFGGAQVSITRTLPAGLCDMSADLTIDHPQLWSLKDPHLYEGSVSLDEDVVHTYIGLREIGVIEENGIPRIALNGAPVYINGTLDQAFNPKGHFTYPDEDAVFGEAFRLKRLGLNMARIHIKPEEPRKLYFMDKLGILIMQDMPCFWGAPTEAARTAYESEWPDAFNRDYNHPCIFSWVMFNETWGLNTQTDDGRKYLPETQEWVRDVYLRAKAADPTRLIEDNSACLYDHVQTDINSWHFYLNGYQVVKDHINNVVDNTFEGSPFNYTGGNAQTRAPLMNSECGMVWGVDGSAGDSDIAWQYKYMLNEFRLKDKLCGFIFTEFHDVPNEFNGYYRIDDTDKDFGYRDFCRGMTIADLHAQDFVAIDYPPCTTVNAGETISLPIKLSSFSGRIDLQTTYELWYDGLDGRVVCASGRVAADARAIDINMPSENALAVLSIYLSDERGVVSRNFATFDVRAEYNDTISVKPVIECCNHSFEWSTTTLNGNKANFFGAGAVTYDMPVPIGGIADIEVFFEAGAKRMLTKDRGEGYESGTDMNFMRGYKVDRGAFKNSYLMTDEEAFPTNIAVCVDGVCVLTRCINNDYADARGVLSWHYQPSDRLLDDAGSYGELIRVSIPSRMILGIVKKGGFKLTIAADNGLSLYGRDAGRYAAELMMRVRGYAQNKFLI